MFFIGISAHIMIYLLVPVFLIVCFYFSGKPDSPEVLNILPVCISYEPRNFESVSADTYVYCISEQKAETEEKCLFVPELIVYSQLPFSFFPKDTHRCTSLRAPPSLIV